MSSEGLGEMFEGDSADMCAGKFSLTSMGGRAEGLACTDREARTPIGVSGNYECRFLARIFSLVFLSFLSRMVEFNPDITPSTFELGVAKALKYREY